MKNNDFRNGNGGDNGRCWSDRDPIIDLLTPKASPLMPESIKSDVLSVIKRREALKNFFTMKNTFSKIVASAAAVAAVAIVAVVSVRPTPAHAAEVSSLLDRSAAAAGDVRTMVMKIDVRTRTQESFSFIDPEGEMVEHTLSVIVGEPSLWRLEKERRTVVFDGTGKYMWLHASPGVKGDETSRFEEWFDILLDPSMVPMREKAAQQEGVKYFVEERGVETVLRADVKAQGNFSESDYSMFSSIVESPTGRELVFDGATGLLKSMKIFVKRHGRQTLIVDLKSVDYNVPVDKAALVALPAGYEWRDVTVPAPAGRFSNVTAAVAAGMIADAITVGSMEPAREAFAQYDFAFIRDYFKGAKVLKTGKPFSSGTYRGVFVPFQVRFADGKTRKITLALRNDNPNGVWLVDGGI